MDNVHDVPREDSPVQDATYGGERAQYKGVYKCGKKFKAQIQIERVQHYLGLFDSEIEAAVAYDNHARIILGARARTNFAYNAQTLPLDTSAVAPIVFTNVSSSSATAKKKRGYAGLNSRIQWATEHIHEPAAKNARWERNETPKLGYQSSYTLPPGSLGSSATTHPKYPESDLSAPPRDQLALLQSLYPPPPLPLTATVGAAGTAVADPPTASHSRPTSYSVIETDEAARSSPPSQPASPLQHLADAAAEAASGQGYFMSAAPGGSGDSSAAVMSVEKSATPAAAAVTASRSGHQPALPSAPHPATHLYPTTAAVPLPAGPTSMAALVPHEHYLQYLTLHGLPYPPGTAGGATSISHPSSSSNVMASQRQVLYRPVGAPPSSLSALPRPLLVPSVSTSSSSVSTSAVSGTGGAPSPSPLPRPATYWAGVLYADPINRTQVWKGSFVHCADAAIKPMPAEFAISRNLFEYVTVSAEAAAAAAGGGVGVVRLPVSGHMIGGYSEVDAVGQVRTFEDTDFVAQFQPVGDGGRAPKQFAVHGRGVGQRGAYTVTGSYSALSGVLEMLRTYQR